MSEQTYSVHRTRRAYDGFMTLDLYEATIRRGGTEVTVVREVHDHGNGAAVLPYDAARRTCLMVRQLRLPVHVVEGDGLILEVAAGLIDPGDESAAEAARREAAEELRYLVHDLRKVGTFYPIPGMVTEQMNCFLATYTPADRITSGYEADEDEVLDVEEWAIGELWAAWQDGRLRDGKAVVCLQALRIERPDLF
ncbi:NUDIX domain-containing protein [Acuticoccus sp.]|uniref:NUDIX domain-containing protein n=1 Tax=Acuticoccus sp. TaxID=1904378 RepID=UPI003B52232F